MIYNITVASRVIATIHCLYSMQEMDQLFEQFLQLGGEYRGDTIEGCLIVGGITRDHARDRSEQFGEAFVNWLVASHMFVRNPIVGSSDGHTFQII